MIDFTSTRRDIEDYIKNNYTSTLVAYENELPDLGDVNEYISLNDTTINAERIMVGDPSQRIDGLLTISIHTPLGNGTNRSREIASILSELVINKNEGSVEFTESILQSVPTTVKSIYFQQNLHLPYVTAYGNMSIEC